MWGEMTLISQCKLTSEDSIQGASGFSKDPGGCIQILAAGGGIVDFGGWGRKQLEEGHWDPAEVFRDRLKQQTMCERDIYFATAFKDL